MNIPILYTKLYIPQTLPGELIARPRLTERLTAALARKLTLISAPAGSGKTTLISQGLAYLRLATDDLRLEPGDQSEIVNPQVAWVSLDENDNDPVRFWTYIIAALETVQPDLGAAALPLLHSLQPSPLDVVLTPLLNDLAALPHNLILVLDDYHFIENAEVHASLVFFLDRLPLQVRLVVTSRADPPLPLARWRVKRQLAELRADDLRFTLDESVQFFNQLMGLALSADNVAALDTKTEGWIAGLQLAALSLQGRGDVEEFIATFTGNHRYIFDYITEEILHRQSAGVQAFLLQTAVLERLNGALCDAVTGRSDSQAMLEGLARANLFIIPLDEQGQWYRYHRLFADLLRHQLRQTPPDEAAAIDITELHRRAADWYEQAGWIEETISHALAAQDFERVERLILLHARTIIDRGGAMLLLRWFNALPETWVQPRLKLGLFQAWLLFFTGHLEEVQHKLNTLEAALSQPQAFWPETAGDEAFKNNMPGLLASLQAQIALVKGDIPRVIELSQQALARLSPDEFGPRSICAQNLALAYWMSGETERANQVLIDFGTVVPHNNEMAALITLNNMAELKRMQGQHRQAFALYRQLLQLVAEKESPGLSPLAGTAHTEVGHLLYEWNDLPAAEFHLRRGIELGNQGAGFRALSLGYVGLFRLYLAQKQFAAAQEIIHQAEQLALIIAAGPLPEMIIIMRVNLWLAQGDLAALARWIQATGLNAQTEFDGHRNAFIYTVLARTLLALGDLPAAAALAARLLGLWEAAKHQDRIIEILALQAVIFQAQHKPEQATTALQRALSLAQPQGYIRLFVDNGPPLAALLAKIQPQPPAEAEYLHALLATFDDAPPVDAPAPPGPDLPPEAAPEPPDIAAMPELLTRRELEVLQLLATGLSGQEIADKLVITKNTLKVHLKRVYDKLEVKTRAQAVVKGRALNLL